MAASSPSARRTYIDPRDLPAMNRATAARILAQLRPYRGQAALVLIAIVGAALLNALPPLFLRRIIDQALPARHTTLLLVLCGAMAAAPLLAGLLGVAQKYLAAFIAERVV